MQKFLNYSFGIIAILVLGASLVDFNNNYNRTKYIFESLKTEKEYTQMRINYSEQLIFNNKHNLQELGFSRPNYNGVPEKYQSLKNHVDSLLYMLDVIKSAIHFGCALYPKYHIFYDAIDDNIYFGEMDFPLINIIPNYIKVNNEKVLHTDPYQYSYTYRGASQDTLKVESYFYKANYATNTIDTLFFTKNINLKSWYSSH